MSEDLHDLRDELIEVFTRYGVVPHAYDYDLWTREQHENWLKNRLYIGTTDLEETFEDDVESEVEMMLGLK